MAHIYRDMNMTLWDEFVAIESPGLADVRNFLNELSLHDMEIVESLEGTRGVKGRNDYPVRAMWNATGLMFFLRHKTVSGLISELKRNETLAYLIGFKVEGGRVMVPEKHVFSRFHKSLHSRADILRDMVDGTVRKLKRAIPGFGEKVAIDSTNIRTHARPPSKAKPGREAKASADADASWSVKTKDMALPDGSTGEKTVAVFGYKAHVMVDQRHAAVISISMSTGSSPDVAEAPGLISHAESLLGADVIQEVACDKAYDSEDFVRNIVDRGMSPVIPVRDVPEKLKNQKAEDRETVLAKQDNITYDRYSGEVFCYDKSDPTTMIRRKMMYAGCERDRETHKFRCPAAKTCPFRQKCGGGTSGKQGRQVRIPWNIDIRRFAPIYPLSKRWLKARRGRTAVERCFSIMKGPFLLEDHALRGKPAITVRALLCALTLNITTLCRLTVAERETDKKAA